MPKHPVSQQAVSSSSSESKDESLVVRFGQLSVAKLLEELEKLKTDKVKTQFIVETPIACFDYDYYGAQDIRTKLKELMTANKTLQSLSFSWTYSHKNYGRELKVYAEEQQIKVHVMNGDNTVPGFPLTNVPGFDEVSGYDLDDNDELILSKVVDIYDRSPKKELTAPAISIFITRSASMPVISTTAQTAMDVDSKKESVASRVAARHRPGQYKD